MKHLVRQSCFQMLSLSFINCVWSQAIIYSVIPDLLKWVLKCLTQRILWSLRGIMQVNVPNTIPLKTYQLRASLVAQWLRICLPMQGTRLWTLVREDPTCSGATKPAHHNYWACALEPVSHSYWAHVLQLLKPTLLEPVLCHRRSHRNEKPVHRKKE